MENLETVVLQALDEALANIHTIVVAKVTKVNETTINVKPVINRLVDGVSVELPEFLEVPLVTLQGGNSYIHYPVTVGDYCLLLVSERCFDKWYQGKDFDTMDELSMFDYSDSFAIVGINPLGKAIPIPTTTTMQGGIIHNGKMVRNGDTTINGSLNVSIKTTSSEVETTTLKALNISTGGVSGKSGSFTTNDGKTITVSNGIITSII
jgi:hypothetical protein